MRVFKGGFAEAKGKLTGCAVALGNFDGVHLGHQALFAAALHAARARGVPAVAATFEPHPGKVLHPDLAPKLLTPLARKLELLEALGLDAVVLQPFDRTYAGHSAEQFLDQDLFGSLDPKLVVVGADFTFGRGRSGTAATLEAACRARGARFDREPTVTVDGVVVSSTKIREFVAEGRIQAANCLLGRPFDLTGLVIHGEGRGRTLGFPTANLQPDNEVRPGIGVYAVRAFTSSGPFGGAANVGRKPTFGGQEVSIEVFLFDFSGELYGSRIGVEFLERLRGEQRFGSVEELKAQIAADVTHTRESLARASEPGPLSPGAKMRHPAGG